MVQDCLVERSMYKHILVPIDGSETSARAFDVALEFARENGAELQPVHVINPPTVTLAVPGYDQAVVNTALFQEGTQIVNGAVERMRRDGVKGTSRIVEVDLLGDDIEQCILRACVDAKADLVVMGTHGRRGIQRLVLGSVAERFLRIATCPVLLVPGRHNAQTEGAQGNKARLT